MPPVHDNSSCFLATAGLCETSTIMVDSDIHTKDGAVKATPPQMSKALDVDNVTLLLVKLAGTDLEQLGPEIDLTLN